MFSQYKYKIITTIILVSCIFSSCYTFRGTGLLQEQRLSLPEYDRAAYQEYRLQINDEIVFRLITSDAEMSAVYGGGGIISYRIANDGTIDLPFVRTIHIEGLTLREATTVVQNVFREIVPDATIRMAIENRTFTVIGDVGTGIFPVYKDRLTIYQALALAGDLQISGDRRRITILRQTNEGLQRMEFDIRPRSVIESEFYWIYPNDIIYVRRLPSSFFKLRSYQQFVSLVNTTAVLFMITRQFRN